MLSVQNMSFFYRSSSKVFDDLTLHIPEGKCCGVFGKNGAGKSTYFSLLTGLQKPRSGTCTVRGMHSYKRSRELLQSMFFIPQSFVLPHMKIVAFSELMKPLYPHFSHDTLMESLEVFQLNPKRWIHDLSYGEKKKTLCALAFSLHIPMLLMDEPTESMDIPSTRAFRNLVVKSKQRGDTLLIATHHIQEISDVIDAIVIIDKGILLCYHTIEELQKKFYSTVLPHEPEKNSSVLYYEQIRETAWAVLSLRSSAFADNNMEKDSLEENLGADTWTSNSFSEKNANAHMLDIELLCSAVMKNTQAIMPYIQDVSIHA